MQRGMKSVANLLLALIVALSSVTMAQARHQARASAEAVLCTGMGMIAVAVDAQGNPVGPMLPCPECTPAGLALADAPPPGPGGVWCLRALAPLPPATVAWPARAPRHRHARAPPAAV